MSKKLGKLLICWLLQLIQFSPPEPFIAVTPGVSMHVKLSENFRAVFYAPFYATHALGFYTSEGVEVELLNSPAPAAAAAGLLDGSIDIAWGGPMRVMKARDDDPQFAAGLLLRGCGARSVLSGRQGRSFGISARRPAAAEDRDRVGGADALALSAARPAPARRRSGADRSRDRPDDGGQSGGAAPGRARRGADVRAIRLDGVARRAQARSSMRRTRAGRPSIRRSSPAATAFAATARPSTPWCGPPAARWPGSRSTARQELADAVAPYYPHVAARTSGKLASALPGCGTLGAHAGSVAAGIRAAGRQPEIRRLHFPAMHAYEDCVDQSLC